MHSHCVYYNLQLMFNLLLNWNTNRIISRAKEGRRSQTAHIGKNGEMPKEKYKRPKDKIATNEEQWTITATIIIIIIPISFSMYIQNATLRMESVLFPIKFKWNRGIFIIFFGWCWCCCCCRVYDYVTIAFALQCMLFICINIFLGNLMR